MDTCILSHNGYFSQCQRFGAEGEAYVLGQLRSRGYDVRPLASWTDQADLIIDAPVPVPVLVEVKTAAPRIRRQRARRGWYQRTFYSWEVGRVPRTFDLVVVLVATTPAGPVVFVVPSWLVTRRSVIHIANDPADYVSRGRGWLAPFYGQWDQVVRDVALVRQRYSRSGQQLTLWGTAG